MISLNSQVHTPHLDEWQMIVTGALTLCILYIASWGGNFQMCLILSALRCLYSSDKRIPVECSKPYADNENILFGNNVSLATNTIQTHTGDSVISLFSLYSENLRKRIIRWIRTGDNDFSVGGCIGITAPRQTSIIAGVFYFNLVEYKGGPTHVHASIHELINNSY